MSDDTPITITDDIVREVRALNEWSDADRALLALRVNRAEVERISASYDAQIQRLQEAKQRALAPVVGRIERTKERLEAFVTEHRDEMDGQSITLTHGRVGYRRSAAKVELFKGEEFTLRMLELRKHDGCIAIKKKVDKKAVKDLSGGELAICGVHVLTGEKFFAKLADSPAVVYPDVAAGGKEG